MSQLLFNLRNVPDDEANAVRSLLFEHQIAFYETGSGSWGISLPGIWLHNSSDWAVAKQLIDCYQIERQQSSRADFEQQKQTGTRPSLFSRPIHYPIRFLFALLLVGFILYISLQPFLQLP